MTSIVVLSDLHLSPTHGFFWENWRIARDVTNRLGADAIIVNGDLCIDGPDSDAEIEFAVQTLRELKGPVFALPGNHDVGDEPPGQDPAQLVTRERLKRWNMAFGSDRWSFKAGRWRLIGLNSQLFGSGLADEADQETWFDQQLVETGDRPIALFLHKPLFLDHADEQEIGPASMTPAARMRLLPRLQAANVRLVVSGHLHQSRDRMIDGIRHVWLPAVAFKAPYSIGGEERCGFAVFRFSDTTVDIQLQYPSGLISHELNTIKQNGKYAFLRDMPPCPPPSAS